MLETREAREDRLAALVLEHNTLVNHRVHDVSMLLHSTPYFLLYPQFSLFFGFCLGAVGKGVGGGVLFSSN